jgi:antitoxin ParD1/3/4
VTTLNLPLSESDLDFIKQQAASEGYSGPTEYVEALIREDRRRKALRELEAKLLKGLDSGPATEMTAEEWQDIRQEVVRRHELRKRA